MKTTKTVKPDTPTPASSISRRSFLKRSIGMAAAAPMILPRSVLGIQGSPGANQRLVFGGIGVGRRGPGILRWLKESVGEGGVVAALSDVYLPRARERAKELGVKDVYQDYRRLLDRRDIDAVLIATPLHWHALNCIHAAQAGKDIFCEKPLSYSVVEGRRIVQAVRKYKRVFQTGVQGRMHRNSHFGCTLLRNGILGKIHRVVAFNYHSPMEPDFPEQKIPEGLDWEMWCGPGEKLPFNFVIWDNGSVPSWVSLRPFSGSAMTDWGSHGLDIAQWALGMDESGPEEVWVEGEPFREMRSSPEDPGVRMQGPDSPVVMMKYPGNITMELSRRDRWTPVDFIGEHGTLTVSRDSFSSNPPELMRTRLDNPDIVLHRGFEHAVNNSLMRDWVDCIRERRDPAAHVEAGHRTATVCHLGNIARWVSGLTGETGLRLKWDAGGERFTNSPEANRFLNPPRRKGFELPERV